MTSMNRNSKTTSETENVMEFQEDIVLAKYDSGRYAHRAGSLHGN